MNIEFDAYKVKLNDVKPALDGLAESLNMKLMKTTRVVTSPEQVRCWQRRLCNY